MAEARPTRSWIFALVTLLGIGAVGAFFVLRGGGPSADDAALIRAFERETGLFLRVGSSELSASAGTWRAESIELRTARDAEPMLRAEAATLHLNVAELLRGQAHIERAVIEGAQLTIDLRAAKAEGSAARAIDMVRLHARLPARIEAAKLGLHVQTDGAGSFDLAGVDLTLARDAGGMTGRLRSPEAGSSELRRAEQVTRLALDTAMHWDANSVELRETRVTLGSSVLAGSARFDNARAFDLALAGEQVDLADLAFLSGAAAQTLSGKGRVELHIGAPAIDPSVLVDLRDATVRKLKLDRVRASLTQDATGWIARDVSIERGAERWSAATLALGAGALDAELRPVGTFRIERLDLRSAIGVPAAAAGTLELERQGEHDLSVVAELELADVEIAKHKLDKGQLSARFTLANERIHGLVIDKLELSSRDAKITAQGKVSDSGALELTVKGSAAWAGLELLGEGTARGTYAAPELAVRVTPTKLAGERGAAQADLVFTLSDKALSDKQAVRGTVELSNFDLGGYLPALEHAGAPSGRLTARLEITAGTLDDLRSIQGKGEVSALSLGYGDLSFESSAFPLVLRDGRIDLSGVTLAHESARWTLRGGIGLDRSLDLTSSAELALAPLLASAPYVGAVEGRIAIDLALSGKLDAMTVTGRAEPRAVELEIGPEETRWRKLQGYVSLEASTLRFHEVTGTFGTGTLALSGSIGLSGLRVSTVELLMVARKLSFEPQERFQFVLDADTVLSWSRKEAKETLPKLSGRVTLSRLLYMRHVQLPEAVIAMGRSSGTPHAPTIALDLVLENSAPLSVRNDFLDVELGVAHDEPFRIVGTDARLGARGELTVVRGRALFRGAVLTVRDGRIGFRSDERIVPALDLKADAPAKRRPGALILFEAHGDPSRFGLEVRCAPKDGAGSPTPFECTYDGDEMTCGRFEELTALWACEKG